MSDAVAIAGNPLPVSGTVAVRRYRSGNPAPTVAAVAVLMVAAIYLDVEVSWRQGVLLLIGAAAGVVLYHAAFGFTSAWRQWITARRGDGVRAQMLMLALTCTVFFPLLARGELLGQSLRGSVSPIAVSVVAGAFVFGIGMQIAGGCASGTLYTAGGGNVRMLITLVAFIAGSVIGTAHMPWWISRPSFGAVSIVDSFGAWNALALSLAAFGGIAALTVLLERRRPSVSGAVAPAERSPTWLRGPWPPAAGGVGLAIVNVATLLVAGRPWGITSAFALWGAKVLLAMHVAVDLWPYWSTTTQRAVLHGALAADVTSVMDGGLLLGAMAAAGLAGRFAPDWRIRPRLAAASLVGGLMLGYGARIAYGCNIGAYFSGISSGSLHGWVWLAAALAGNVAGIRARMHFGLDPRPTD